MRVLWFKNTLPRGVCVVGEQGRKRQDHRPFCGVKPRNSEMMGRDAERRGLSPGVWGCDQEEEAWDEPGCSPGVCEKDGARWWVSVVSDKWECGVLCTEDTRKGMEGFQGENKSVDLDL